MCCFRHYDHCLTLLRKSGVIYANNITNVGTINSGNFKAELGGFLLSLPGSKGVVLNLFRLATHVNCKRQIPCSLLHLRVERTLGKAIKGPSRMASWCQNYRLFCIFDSTRWKCEFLVSKEKYVLRFIYYKQHLNLHIPIY